jgi:hypothetical protein
MASTMDEELHEVWSSVLESLCMPPDEDREAACRRLMRHLVDSGCPNPGAYKLTGTASSKIACGS